MLIAVAAPVDTNPPIIEVKDGRIPLKALGIKMEDFLSERELRRRNTTKFSEAEEEIMELEEWEVGTEWYNTLQNTLTALASAFGIFVLYKGGVLWQRGIKEQE